MIMPPIDMYERKQPKGTTMINRKQMRSLERSIRAKGTKSKKANAAKRAKGRRKGSGKRR